MGRLNTVDRLPKNLRAIVISLIEVKYLTQEDITNRVNEEAGKKVISKSSINRFIKRLRKEKAERNSTSISKSLERIATAIERIADGIENLTKKEGFKL